MESKGSENNVGNPHQRFPEDILGQMGFVPEVIEIPDDVWQEIKKNAEERGHKDDPGEPGHCFDMANYDISPTAHPGKMEQEDKNLSPERRKALYEELRKRGFYYPGNPFNDLDSIEKSDNPKYELKISIYKWNTSSNCLVVIGARWDAKKSRYVLSTYKGSGSCPRQKHGEKMR